MTLTREDRLRAADRARIAAARGRGGRAGLLLVFIGPGVLAIVGENDGPSMLSYAASGAQYGAGFFLPFIVVTFVGAVFVQNIGVRVGAVTHRGFSELIHQRYGRFWGLTASLDLVLTNLVTIVAELVAIRVGFAFFGIPGWVAVVAAVGLVALSTFAGSFHRWQSIALGLAAFNLLFLVAAFFCRPDPAAITKAFVTWTPFPQGSLSAFLLIAASDIGATVTPWMLFFQQSATTDKGLVATDVRGGSLDTVIGGVVAVLTGCAALVCAIPLFTHHVTVVAEGGAAYADALVPLIGPVGPTLFSLGLIEAGALAVLTISASSAYALGELVPGGAHSFNDRGPTSRVFHGANIALVLIGGVVTLIPGAPLLSIALNANLLATVLMPAALVFVLLIARDREVMGDARLGLASTGVAVGIAVVITIAGAGYAIVAFVQAIA